MTMVNMPENNGSSISKRIRNVSHKYPSLVGTLDKVKFVMDNDAIQKGVYDDSNVKVFERDFLRKQFQKTGINRPHLFPYLKAYGSNVQSAEKWFTEKT